MTEHYPELASEIDKIDDELQGELQTWFIKRLELRIQLEIAEQLHRIADRKAEK